MTVRVAKPHTISGPCSPTMLANVDEDFNVVFRELLAPIASSDVVTAVSTVTASSVIAVTDHTLVCTGTVTVTLPTALGITGQAFEIKNAGTGVVTVATTGTDLIDGVATKLLAAGDCGVCRSIGSGWILV